MDICAAKLSVGTVIDINDEINDIDKDKLSKKPTVAHKVQGLLTTYEFQEHSKVRYKVLTSYLFLFFFSYFL